jgi:hypothetical protein
MASTQDIQPFKVRLLKCTDRYRNCGTQKIRIIATESKRQRRMTPLTTALFLSTIVTRTRSHTELTKKTDKPDGKPVLCQRTFS